MELIRKNSKNTIKDGKWYRCCSMCRIFRTIDNYNYAVKKRGWYKSYCKICDKVRSRNKYILKGNLGLDNQLANRKYRVKFGWKYKTKRKILGILTK